LFASDRPVVYEQVYQGLRKRLAGADLGAAARDLGLVSLGPGVAVPCLGKTYLVDAQGVRTQAGGPAPLNLSIVLAYYLLHGGRGEVTGRFVPYRQLPGGQDFARSLSQTVEGRLARHFSGRPQDLSRACAEMGGRAAAWGVSADLSFTLPALPKIPLGLTFYDADEDFPAEAKIFYDLTATNFLDLECLAVLGMIAVQELEQAAAGWG